MPIDGHPPTELPPFGLHVCAPCRNGFHSECRPIRLHRLTLACECLPFDFLDGRPILLPCIEELP